MFAPAERSWRTRCLPWSTALRMTRPWSQRPLLGPQTAPKIWMWTLKEPSRTSRVCHRATHSTCFSGWGNALRQKRRIKRKLSSSRFWRMQLRFFHREKPCVGSCLAAETGWEEPPTPHPQTAAGLLGLCGLVFHCILLLLLVPLSAVLLFLLCHHSPLPLPLKVSLDGVKFQPGHGCIPASTMWQPRWQLYGGTRGGRWGKAPVYQPRYFQPGEGQAETKGAQAFNLEAHQRRRWP